MDRRASDRSRRIWLRTAVAVGGCGVVATAVPFVETLEPSERARALGAAVEVEVGSMRPGELRTVEWRGRPVWLLKRSDAMVDRLKRDAALLVDPESKRSEQPDGARNPWRSLKPELGVMVAICTHLGCIPTYRPEPGGGAQLGDDWPGGFLCPCHGSKFDLAGRVFRNVPAPINLEVPDYRYLSDTRLRIGEPTDAA